MLGVGGDYYDFIELDKNRLFFCIGDVSNHGVGPAIVMAVLRANLHGIIKAGERDLTTIMLDLNRRLFLETPPHIFVTFFAGIIDRTTNKVSYCSAGHMKPALCRHKNGEIERLKAGGLPLGMDDNDIFADTISVVETSMNPGDLFFQFTDGMSEAMDAKRNMFTEERLMDAVKDSYKKKMDLFIKNVATSVQEFTGKDMFAASGMTDLNDDCAMIAFKRLK